MFRQLSKVMHYPAIIAASIAFGMFLKAHSPLFVSEPSVFSEYSEVVPKIPKSVSENSEGFESHEAYIVDRGWLTTKDIAKTNGVTQRTVLNWIEEGKLEGEKVNDRWRIPLNAHVN